MGKRANIFNTRPDARENPSQRHPWENQRLKTVCRVCGCSFSVRHCHKCNIGMKMLFRTLVSFSCVVDKEPDEAVKTHEFIPQGCDLRQNLASIHFLHTGPYQFHLSVFSLPLPFLHLCPQSPTVRGTCFISVIYHSLMSHTKNKIRFYDSSEPP